MSYSNSFKKQILELCRNGVSVSTIAMDHNVPRSTIYRWIREENTHQSSEKVHLPYEVKALERKVAKLENIITILKTVPCTVHAPLKDRLNALEQLHSEYNVHTLCEALNVSPGTYYNHILRNKRDNVEKAKTLEITKPLNEQVQLYLLYFVHAFAYPGIFSHDK